MPRLPDRATAEEACIASGYSDPEWRRFIDITKNIARELREDEPEIRWAKVAFNKKCRITDQTNARLGEEGIAAIGVELVGWRMSRVIGNLHYAKARSSKCASVSPAPDPASNPVNTTNTRTFDPIRDI